MGSERVGKTIEVTPLAVSESPKTIYGRVQEAAHISGYSFERLCANLEWLLEEDRWKEIGDAFSTASEFVRSIDLSPFDMKASSRKALTEKLLKIKGKDEKPPSQRAIAEALGVSHVTVQNDLRGKNLPPKEPEAAPEKEPEITTGKNLPPTPPPTSIGGREAAKQIEKREIKKTARVQQKAQKLEEDLRASRQIVESAEEVVFGDFVELSNAIATDSVALIFTDPPYDRKSLPMFSELSRLAARVLVDGGSLITFCGQYVLDEAIARLSEDLRYFWIGACVHSGNAAQMKEYGIKVEWKPLLWFVKGSFRRDREIWVEDIVISQKEKDDHPWQQSVIEASHFIERLTHPTEVVLDPFCGSGTTAVAAKQLGRRWLTYENDRSAYGRAVERIRQS